MLIKIVRPYGPVFMTYDVNIPEEDINQIPPRLNEEFFAELRSEIANERRLIGINSKLMIEKYNTIPKIKNKIWTDGEFM